jgi:hypothetical protein
MDILTPQITETPTVVEPSPDVLTKVESEPLDLLIKAQKHFEVAKDNYPQMDMLRSVLQMLGESGLTKTGDVLLAIHDIEMKLGGKSSLQNIYNYLRINGQILDLIKQKLSFHVT